jgi:hypothetical protein
MLGWSFYADLDGRTAKMPALPPLANNLIERAAL